MEELLEINSESKEIFCQFSQIQTFQTFYLGYITYGATQIFHKLLNIPKKLDKNFDTNDISFNLARFINTCILQSHIHMVSILKMLNANFDNKGNNESNILKQAICHLNRLK